MVIEVFTDDDVQLGLVDGPNAEALGALKKDRKSLYKSVFSGLNYCDKKRVPGSDILLAFAFLEELYREKNPNPVISFDIHRDDGLLHENCKTASGYPIEGNPTILKIDDNGEFCVCRNLAIDENGMLSCNEESIKGMKSIRTDNATIMLRRRSDISESKGLLNDGVFRLFEDKKNYFLMLS